MSSDMPRPRWLQWRLTIVLFAAMFGALGLGYFLFLRADYVPVFSQMRGADAAAVVTQLEAKKIAYRLGDGGTTILVPSDQADLARLAIAGSSIALKGGVGFELFNKSDMGLTDFAQRINYQRALQGELERSIMMIAEVETARVHLAMPERTIFRSERSNAKAAVELLIKPGSQFDGSRVVGVQRLIAFAVPDLAPTDVVVLDGNGRVLGEADGDDAFLSPDAEERRGLQAYYRARARAALQQALPGLQADVHVIALARDVVVDDRAPTPAVGATDANADTVRDIRLRVIVATGVPLNAEDRLRARAGVAAAVALDEAAGDELSFRVGLGSRPAQSMARSLPQAGPMAGGTVADPASATPWLFRIMGGILLLVAGSLLIPLILGMRTRLSASERDAMIARVRVALRQAEAGHADA